jgi:uncharacterized protein (DUF169 family)
MDERTARLNQAITEGCRPTTAPVGVRLARPGESPPPKTKYPIADIGRRLAVCQGMTAARTLGWAMAFGAADHACPLPRVFMGHVAPDRFLEGSIADAYQEDPACMRLMEASYPRWPVGDYAEFWLAPLSRCEFVPDLAVVYGTPAQVLALVQAANFGKGPGIASTSTGRYGCSLWIAGVAQSGDCTFMIPGPGERIFAGTQDHEMSFAVPYPKFDDVVAGLDHIRRRGAYRYPVPNMGMLAEPKIPEKYFSVDPGAQTGGSS